MENPIKMDDLGVPLFPETSIWRATLENFESVWTCLIYKI